MCVCVSVSICVCVCVCVLMCECVCICVCLCMYVGAEMTRLQVLDGYTTTKSLYRDLSRAGVNGLGATGKCWNRSEIS